MFNSWSQFESFNYLAKAKDGAAHNLKVIFFPKYNLLQQNC